MANDSPQDQQVAERPGQTAPVPVPEGLQPAQPQAPAAFNGWDQIVAKQGEEPAGWRNLVTADKTVNMLTPNGSQSGEVPLHKVQEAREAGHHIAIPMTAPPPDERKGWVPYHRVVDALASGFKHANEKLTAAGDELSNLTSVGLLPAFLKTPKGKEISDQFNQEIQGYLHDPQKRAETLVGLVQPGAGEGGPLEEGVAEGKEALEAAIKKARTAPSGREISIPPRQTTGIHDSVIEAGGGIPGGIQKGSPEENIPDYAMFHDPQTGSSHMLPVGQVTPENVAKNLEMSRAAYAAGDIRAAARLKAEESQKAALKSVPETGKPITLVTIRSRQP